MLLTSSAFGAIVSMLIAFYQWHIKSKHDFNKEELEQSQNDAKYYHDKHRKDEDYIDELYEQHRKDEEKIDKLKDEINKLKEALDKKSSASFDVKNNKENK